MSKILETQKNVASLRKAVTEITTKINSSKRTVKNYNEYLKSARDAEHQAHIQGLIDAKLATISGLVPELVKAQHALDAAVSALPVRKPTKYDRLLKWFSGKALVNAQDALDLLDASEEAGSWIPGAARKVRAALGKANVAKKTIKTSRDFRATAVENALDSAIRYGIIDSLGRISLQDATKTLSDNALEFFVDFKPAVDTLDRLDATRAKPTFTKLGASPTISAELERQGATAVNPCPIEYRLVETKDEKGRVSYHYEAFLLWPAGIKHHTSRYHSTNNNFQCQACGHAIKNGFNWVPLILTDKDGSEKSLWVGRDCSKTLFGVELVGDLELAKGQR